MTAYYNERDAFKAQVIREAIQAGALPAGDVDERSIADVAADDLRGYRQCHFFAGGGFWALALRQAGWPDDREVWTGSCPCPSFSAAGKGRGFDDPRHLWPEWFRLLRERRPATVFGEQVAAAIGHGWLDLVHSDLEGADYAVAAAVLGACSVGAPHIRQRLYFCADAETAEVRPRSGEVQARTGTENANGLGDGSLSLDRADAEGWRRGGLPDAKCRFIQPEQYRAACSEHGLFAEDCGTSIDSDSARGGFGIARSAPGNAGHALFAGDAGERQQPIGAGLEGHFRDVREWRGPGWLDPHEARSIATAGATRGFWSDCDWWYGRDGKYRPIEPGIFPLVTRDTARVGRLRMYGDAICVPIAQAFIESYMEEGTA